MFVCYIFKSWISNLRDLGFQILESWITNLRNDDQALHILFLTSRPVGSPGGQDDRGGPPPGGGRPLQGDDIYIMMHVCLSRKIITSSSESPVTT